MSRWITAHVLIALGLGWFIVDWLLTVEANDSWGGPNIGAGFFLLCAAAAVLLRVEAVTAPR